MPQVFSGGLDNHIKVWELRKGAVSYAMKGHADTVTGMQLSPDGKHLLTNAMDNTLRVWDVQAYAPQDRWGPAVVGSTACVSDVENAKCIQVGASWARPRL